MPLFCVSQFAKSTGVPAGISDAGIGLTGHPSTMIDDLIDLTTMQPSKVLRTRFTPTDLMWIVVVGGVPYLCSGSVQVFIPAKADRRGSWPTFSARTTIRSILKSFSREHQPASVFAVLASFQSSLKNSSRERVPGIVASLACGARMAAPMKPRPARSRGESRERENQGDNPQPRRTAPHLPLYPCAVQAQRHPRQPSRLRRVGRWTRARG